MTGHTHEKVDGWHVHLRAFMLGIMKRTLGACVALPCQLLQAMIGQGPKSIWNRAVQRCMWAGIKSIVRKYKVRKYTVIRSKEYMDDDEQKTTEQKVCSSSHFADWGLRGAHP